MCGIIGVASSEGNKNRSNRIQFMKMGLDIDSWRGWDSTGLALVPEGHKESPLVYKRALNGRDFIQLHQVEKYLSDIEKYPVVIGHNRSATSGRGLIIDRNAHPFQYGNITLVHNGHIRNSDQLKGARDKAGSFVDSAHVSFSMDSNGELDTLEQVEGGFVFVWWNSDTSCLNIARNTERPLHMAFIEKENTFYWASELTELLHLLKDFKIDEEVGLLYPTPWNWYQFNLKDLRDYKKVPFVHRQGRQSVHTATTTGYRGHGPTGGGGYFPTWTSRETEAWEERMMEQAMEYSNNGEGCDEDECGEDEIEEIRKEVTNQRLKDARQAGTPTTQKRLERAKAELKKLGIEYNAMKNCTPKSWCRYRNQKDLGSVLCTTNTGGHLVEVLQVREQQYEEYMKVGNLLVDCVNVRTGQNNDVFVVGHVSKYMETYLNMKRGKENEEKFPCHGPDGEKISLHKFLELTGDGCAHCTRDLVAKESQDITWVGSNPPSPLCLDCATSPKIMEMLGLSDDKPFN